MSPPDGVNETVKQIDTAEENGVDAVAHSRKIWTNPVTIGKRQVRIKVEDLAKGEKALSTSPLEMDDTEVLSTAKVVSTVEETVLRTKEYTLKTLTLSDNNLNVGVYQGKITYTIVSLK